MTYNEIEIILKNKGISPTPVRKLIYQSLLKSELPLSLNDLLNELETVDKSSISRTLSVFRENNIVNFFDDGSGSVKYEINQNSEKEINEESHIHFHCLNCGETTCLHELIIPRMELPDGYDAISSNFIISGICSKCNKQ